MQLVELQLQLEWDLIFICNVIITVVEILVKVYCRIYQ